MESRSPRARDAFCALLAALCLSCAGGREARRIVLITLDTLRYDRFAGGAEWPADMPHTRRFAEGALVFERHYSATSTTQPTHASLLTGLHPWQHGVSRNGQVLPDEVRTIAEILGEAGYRSAAVVASFPLHRRFGFAQGFDRYDDAFSVEGPDRWNEQEVPEGAFASHADHVTERALAALDRIEGPRQLLWIHYFDPHSPYGDSTGEPLMTLAKMSRQLRSGGTELEPLLAAARKGYSRDVRFMDEQLDRVFARLREDADRFETHVVVVGDHGESFGEGGSLGHGKRLTDEQIRVPLLIRSPRAAPGRIGVPNGSVDVTATLLALAGLGGVPTEGRSLLAGSANGGPVFGMRRTFAEPYREVRTDGIVHIVDGFHFYAVEEGRMLEGNASAVRAGDAAPLAPGVAERLGALFGSFERTLTAQDPQERLDPDTREALEALGYAR